MKVSSVFAAIYAGFSAPLLLFGCSQLCSAFVPSSGGANVCRRRHTQQRILTLRLAKETKGVYVRPSAAIERGSGFFIPGLEGPRVRLLFGLTVLVLTTVNHVLRDTVTSSSFTEILAVGYSILLLLQAAIEFGKEDKGYVVSLDRPDSFVFDESTQDSILIQRWATDAIAPEWKEKVQWSAASYLALTPAMTIMLLDNEKVLYSLGPTDETIDADPNAMTGCRAALNTLSNAKSSRVSLPATHPAVMALAPQACQGRCVVLESVNDDLCWMMASDQLIQAFTNQDLRWLGQLARYIKQK